MTGALAMTDRFLAQGAGRRATARPSEPDADWDVLARVAAGDAEAFTGVVESYQDRLIGVCERLLHDPEEARDAAQEVLLKVFRRADRIEPRAKLFTFLYRVAVNHCLNRLRRRRLVRMLPFLDRSDEDGVAFDPPAETPDAHCTLESRRRWRETRRAIASLPINQRSVLVLAKFEGLPYREIAEILGITEGAVESRLFRAMRNLERAVERWRCEGGEGMG